MKKDTFKFYNKIYDPLFKKNYTKTSNRGGVSLEVFEKFSSENNVKVRKVIDVGCAWGSVLKYWKKKSIKAVGVDVSKVAVKFCTKRGLKSYKMSVTDLSMFKDNEFDLYMASDVYEHLRTKDLSYAIEEAKRITKQYLLIRPHPGLDKRGRRKAKKALHLTVWSLEKWAEFFKDHGLEVMKVDMDDDATCENVTTYKNVFLMKIK